MDGLEFQRPKALFFDWDGTLVNTVPVIRKAHNHVRETLGLPLWSDQDFYHYVSHSTRELYPRLYGEKAETAIKTLYDYFANNHLKGLELMDGARELVEAVQQLDVPLGIISNKRHKYLLKEIDHLGWGAHFSNVIGAGYAEKDKPAADPLHKALKTAALKAEDMAEIWYVGDMETDLKAAKNAGCRAVFITGGTDKSDMIKKYRPFLVFDDCKALHKHVITCMQREVENST